MLCDNCGKNEAEVHLTQIVDNEMTTVHLCPSCAAEKGLDAGGGKNLPLTDFLAQMGQAAIADEEATGVEPCSYCHTTVDDFRRTGRLGCPHCYSVFESQLRAILRRIHGSTYHLGKVYVPPASEAAERSARLSGLRRKLQRAVEAEDFERAAVIRDQIRELETTADR
ncbi:MAG: UvrB/UvrC motif-containing protein [Gemmatimonadota bacterium]|nr:MAG: UvrB/UvrC motif-containing protein [Gemmatimonadota bacterium]